MLIPHDPSVEGIYPLLMAPQTGVASNSKFANSQNYFFSSKEDCEYELIARTGSIGWQIKNPGGGIYTADSRASDSTSFYTCQSMWTKWMKLKNLKD